MTSYYKWHTGVMEKRMIFFCSIAWSQRQLEWGRGGMAQEWVIEL